MKTKTAQADLAEVLDAMESLRAEVAQLNDRVAALEASPIASARAESAPAVSSAAAPPAAELSHEELMLVISAAVAAFLGERPHIRQIRLIGSASWGQQGRATIQASHSLLSHHT